MVVAQNGDLTSALQLCNCALRHEQSAGLRADDRAHLRITSRPKHVIGIRKESGDADRPRTLIDLAIGKVEPALMFVSGSIGQDQFKGAEPFSESLPISARKRTTVRKCRLHDMLGNRSLTDVLIQASRWKRLFFSKCDSASGKPGRKVKK